jgi:DNA-binding PadR family transcriptional regulator
MRSAFGPDMAGGGWGGGGRRRARRGDVRKLILVALHEGPANGYEIMQRLENRSGGMWRPSPGSVYPTLQLLEDEGLARSQAHDGARTYELTDAGQAEAAAVSADPSGRAPWDRGSEADDGVRALRESAMQLAVAAKQLAHAGRPEQLERGIAIVRKARQDLYGLLAEE